MTSVDRELMKVTSTFAVATSNKMPFDRNNMVFSNLTSSDIAKIAKLISAKETLQERIASINEQLSAFEGGAQASPERSGTAKAPAPGIHHRRKGTRGRKPGKTTERILAALQAAGKTGIHINALAKKAGTSAGTVRTWFYTRGKKQGVKLVGKGTLGIE